MHIGVLDYGMGNLRSVAKALEAAGGRVTVSDDRRQLEATELLVVPGQGAFDAAMTVLKQRRLVDFLKGWISDGRPYLGICLGLQFLFEKSEEAPGERGLGVLEGCVRKFRPSSPRIKVPHMGWNEVHPRQKDFLIPRPDLFYFVHSFFPEPQDSSVVLTQTPYEKMFCSSVATKNVVAVQFHPEKSGKAGLALLQRIFRRFQGASPRIVDRPRRARRSHAYHSSH